MAPRACFPPTGWPFAVWVVHALFGDAAGCTIASELELAATAAMAAPWGFLGPNQFKYNQMNTAAVMLNLDASIVCLLPELFCLLRLSSVEI